MRPRLYEIDLLRIVAALMVVAFHYSFFAPMTMERAAFEFPELDGATRYGYLGVQLFLLISGFVILLSAERSSAADFAAARIGRLMPAYWAAASLTALVVAADGDPVMRVTFLDWAVNLTMLQQFVGVRHIDPVYWTLIVLVKFYALVALWLLAAPRRFEPLLFGWLLLSGLSRFAPEADGAALGSVLLLVDFVFEPHWAPFFVAGGLFCLAYRSGWTPLRGLGAFAACVLALLSAVDQTETYAALYAIALDVDVVIGVVFAFFALFYLISLRLFGWIAWPGFATAGALAYPLYLLHQRIGAIWFEEVAGDLPRYAALAIALACALALAGLVHRFVERTLGPRLRRLGARGLRQIVHIENAAAPRALPRPTAERTEPTFSTARRR